MSIDLDRDAFEAWYIADAKASCGINLTIADMLRARNGDDYGKDRLALNSKWEGWRGCSIAAARERDGLREALTPSGDTKAAYSGEFKMRIIQTVFDECGELDEVATDIPVEWTTIKEIMAAISSRARQALASRAGGEG